MNYRDPGLFQERDQFFSYASRNASLMLLRDAIIT